MKNVLLRIGYWVLNHVYRLIFAALVVVLLHSIWSIVGTPYEPQPFPVWTLDELRDTLLVVAGYLLSAYLAGKESAQ